MLNFVISLGVYSTAIFILGLVNKLHFFTVAILTIFIAIYWILLLRKFRLNKLYVLITSFSLFEKTLLLLLLFLALVNLIGAFGPELSFDATWYHLTIPKIFIEEGKIFYITHPLFYYSLMPKFTEMLYIPALFFGNEIVAKCIHFIFGIFSLYALFKLSRLFLPRKESLLVLLIYYSNLVVAWLSITAYVDLARAFFEITALYFFVLYSHKQSRKHLVASSLSLGLAICTKIISLVSLPIFIALLFLLKHKMRNKLRDSLIYIVVALCVVSPWLIFSYISSGNPIYPIFSSFGPTNLLFTNLYPLEIVKNSASILLFASDPISPIYLISLPLLIATWKIKKVRGIFIYSGLALIIWYIVSFGGIWHATDKSGSSRFLTSYLPALSLLVVYTFYHFKKTFLYTFCVALIIGLALLCGVYRLIANLRYIPYIIGKETKQEFLMKNLNFSFGDFYDENKMIEKITKGERVLLLNMHNLYYVNFPYVLSDSDLRWGGKFILVQNGNLPSKYLQFKKVYSNKTTHVDLYSL